MKKKTQRIILAIISCFFVIISMIDSRFLSAISMKLHPVVERLFDGAQHGCAEKREAFLHPNYEKDLHDPFYFRVCARLFCGSGEPWRTASARLFKGTYDADGIAGSALLVTALERWQRVRVLRRSWRARHLSSVARRGRLWFEFQPPWRGLPQARRVSSLRWIAALPTREEIARAYERGMEVIVVDHQLPQTLFRTRRSSFIRSCRVRRIRSKNLRPLAWRSKVASALYTLARERGVDVPEGLEKWLLDLVAIATVTDMVPLRW